MNGPAAGPIALAVGCRKTTNRNSAPPHAIPSIPWITRTTTMYMLVASKPTPPRRQRCILAPEPSPVNRVGWAHDRRPLREYPEDPRDGRAGRRARHRARAPRCRPEGPALVREGPRRGAGRDPPRARGLLRGRGGRRDLGELPGDVRGARGARDRTR